MSLTDQLYLAQSNIIREMAKILPVSSSAAVQTMCCAIFRTNSTFSSTARSRTVSNVSRPAAINEIEGKTPESALEKMDKQRSTYYNYYTGKVWGKCDHYDLCIKCGRLGVEYSTDIILDFVNRLKK